MAASESELRWLNASDDEVVLSYEHAGELQPALNSEKKLREYWRKSAGQNGGGMVSADLALDNSDALKHAVLIAKYPLKNLGWAYHGVVLIPVSDGLCRLDVKCRERGVTGMRESVAMIVYMKEPKTDDLKKAAAEFVKDPYDPRFNAGAKYSVSDEARWDSGLPEHPLSKCRKELGGYLAALESAK